MLSMALYHYAQITALQFIHYPSTDYNQTELKIQPRLPELWLSKIACSVMDQYTVIRYDST